MDLRLLRAVLVGLTPVLLGAVSRHVGAVMLSDSAKGSGDRAAQSILVPKRTSPSGLHTW